MLYRRTSYTIRRALRRDLYLWATVVVLVAPVPQAVVAQVAHFDLPGGEPIEMIWVEPGEFTMGFVHEAGAQDIDEEPLHQARIGTGFNLSVYEVTRAQWASVMGTSPWGASTNSGDGRRPATHVSWFDVQEFIERVNRSSGMQHYRLPTEAEWEYASRAGTTTTWSFGNSSKDAVHFAWCKDNITAVEIHPPVSGSRSPNPWGLHDMAGSVWEWCSDWYHAYTKQTLKEDTSGATKGFTKVIRGGAYVSFCWETRPANRGSLMPDERSAYVGFRLVREPR
jgi:formylglycine-generating enzyme required for sulfatase activity